MVLQGSEDFALIPGKEHGPGVGSTEMPHIQAGPSFKRE